MNCLTSNCYGVLLRPIRLWLESIEIGDPQTARSLCKLIPARCPFERDQGTKPNSSTNSSPLQVKSFLRSGIDAALQITHLSG